MIDPASRCAVGSSLSTHEPPTFGCVVEEVGIEPDELPGITRRQSLQAGGAVLAALVSPALLAACGSDKSATTAALRGPVILGSGAPPTTFDPQTATDGALTTMLPYVYEGLYGVSPKAPYNVIPELAAGEPEQDGNRYRIALREDAKFHDGSPVTADDVAASFERMLNPKTGSLLTPMLSMVKSVKAAGPDALEVIVRAPTALLKDRLALVRIIPKSLAGEKGRSKAFETRPVGSGPYRVNSISRDLRTLRLDRFRGYNGPLKANFATIGADSFTDPQARIAALQTKRVHAIIDVPRNAMAQLSKSPGLSAGSTLSFSADQILFNCAKKPFDDKRVRQAILHAIDRKSNIKTALFGYGEVAASYLPENWKGYKKPATTLEYDPEKARALLAQAGVPKFSFELMVANLPSLTPQIPLIQSQLADVGITSKIRQGETEALYKYVFDGSYSAFATVGNASVFGQDPTLLVQWIYVNFAPTGLYWKTPEARRLASLVQQAQRTASADELQSLVGQMQDIIADECPAFPMYHSKATAGWSSGLDLKPDPVYTVNFLQARPAAA
ncbi:MAG: peptide/nickel transport system substrate-binding protein [Solirubrobacteraceae bacterium]